MPSFIHFCNYTWRKVVVTVSSLQHIVMISRKKLHTFATFASIYQLQVYKNYYKTWFFGLPFISTLTLSSTEGPFGAMNGKSLQQKRVISYNVESNPFNIWIYLLLNICKDFRSKIINFSTPLQCELLLFNFTVQLHNLLG